MYNNETERQRIEDLRSEIEYKNQVRAKKRYTRNPKVNLDLVDGPIFLMKPYCEYCNTPFLTRIHREEHICGKGEVCIDCGYTFTHNRMKNIFLGYNSRRKPEYLKYCIQCSEQIDIDYILRRADKCSRIN